MAATSLAVIDFKTEEESKEKKRKEKRESDERSKELTAYSTTFASCC